MTSFFDSRRWAKLTLAVLVLVYAQLAWNARDRLAQGASDFAGNYSAARMVKDGQGDAVYDVERETAFLKQILDALNPSDRVTNAARAETLFFVNPPFTLLWILPLASFSYVKAFLLWDLVCLLCFAAGVWALSISKSRLSWATLGLACLAFPPVFIALLQGQFSAFLFLFLAFAYRSLKQEQEVRAGLWLSLLLTKFPLVPPFLLLVLIKRRWRIVFGFLLGALALLLLSIAILGVSGVKRYPLFVIEMATWVNNLGMVPGQMHCLRGQFNAWWYETSPTVALGATVLAGVALLALLIRAWRSGWDVRTPEFDMRFSLLVMVSVLVSPHLYFHDLSVLLVPGILLFQLPKDSEPARLLWVIFLVGYPLMLSSLVVAGWMPIQMSVWGVLGVSLALASHLIACQKNGEIPWWCSIPTQTSIYEPRSQRAEWNDSDKDTAQLAGSLHTDHGISVHQTKLRLLLCRRFDSTHQLVQPVPAGTSRRHLGSALAAPGERWLWQPGVCLLLSAGLLRHCLLGMVTAFDCNCHEGGQASGFLFFRMDLLLVLGTFAGSETRRPRRCAAVPVAALPCAG